MLTTIERVLLFDAIDLFADVATDDLSRLAAVAREQSFELQDVVYSEGDAPDALHVVVEGRIRLERGGSSAIGLNAGDAFGTWSLFDTTPRRYTAVAVEPTRLLSVDRHDFRDVLADEIRLAEGVLRSLGAIARRALGDDPTRHGVAEASLG